MKVDLSEEFSDFASIDFDSTLEQDDYVRQKVLEGISEVAFRAVEWLGQQFPEEDYSRPADQCDYYEAKLIAVLAENRALRAKLALTWNRTP